MWIPRESPGIPSQINHLYWNPYFRFSFNSRVFLFLFSFYFIIFTLFTCAYTVCATFLLLPTNSRVFLPLLLTLGPGCLRPCQWYPGATSPLVENHCSRWTQTQAISGWSVTTLHEEKWPVNERLFTALLLRLTLQDQVEGSGMSPVVWKWALCSFNK
jgi:hypothetical protein